MAYGETNLKQFMKSFMAENVEKVNKEFIWWLIDNREVLVDRCEYDEGTRWTVLRVFFCFEDIKEEKPYGEEEGYDNYLP